MSKKSILSIQWGRKGEFLKRMLNWCRICGFLDQVGLRLTM